MIDEIPIVNEIKTKINKYLDNVEKHVSEISNCQSEKYIEDYYLSMLTAILEIRNTANTLYEMRL